MTSSFFTQIGNDINGEAADDNSGFSLHLSADGSIVAIGSPWNDGNGLNSGHIRIYKNVNNTWTQLGNDINGEAADDEFGYSVNISDDGNVVAVGAHQNSTGNGYVRIYKNVNNTWTKVGSDIKGEGVSDNLGRSVSLSSDGNVVAIGAILHEASGNASGSVKILKNINNTWTQIGNDIDGEDANSFSGRSVSLSSDGSIIAIGADWNDGNGTDSGHVRIYKNINDTWTQVGSDIDGENTGDRSGWAVSLSSDGSIVAIGATDNDENGTDSGHVRIYKNINDTWTQVGSDIDGENTGDFSGVSVSLSSDGTIVAIGSIGSTKDLNGTNSGYVRIYKNINNTWTQIGSDLDGEAAGDAYGTSVSLSSDGTIVAIGASLSDKNGNDSGQVGIYQIDIDTTAPSAPTSLTNTSQGNDNTPIITGTAEAGSTIKLFEGGTLLGSALADSNGAFSITTTTLSDGNYSLTATATDAAGNISDSSSPLNITISSASSLTDLQALNYIASNPDLISTFGTDTSVAKSHYTNYGISEGRNLTAFSATNYLAKYSDLSAAFGSDQTLALKHYIEYGFSEGRTDSSIGSNSSSGASSYLTDFESYNYIASNNDLISAFGIDLEAAKSHYINYGISEGRSLTTFSATNYLAKYSDLSAAFGSDQTLALKHYIEYGFSEGRTDSSIGSNSGASSYLTDFEALNYIASYGDLINAFGTDITSAKFHYTNYGKSEGLTLDDFDEWGYLASNNDLINSLGSDTKEAVKHYISFGYSQGKITNSFDATTYLNNYGDLRNAFGDNKELATKHFVEYGFNEGRLL